MEERDHIRDRKQMHTFKFAALEHIFPHNTLSISLKFDTIVFCVKSIL